MPSSDRFESQLSSALQQYADEVPQLRGLDALIAGVTGRPQLHGVIARVAGGTVSTRPALSLSPASLVLLVLAALLVAMLGAALYPGGRRAPAVLTTDASVGPAATVALEPAPPFGPARNGAILTSTTAYGDIAAIDPLTGAVTPLIVGNTRDVNPLVSPDGRRFLFNRLPNSGGPLDSLYVANVDGTGVRELYGVGGPYGGQVQWAPDSRRIIVNHERPSELGGRPAEQWFSIDDIDAGTSLRLDLGLSVMGVEWRPHHEQLIVEGWSDGFSGLYLVNADGSDLRTLRQGAYGSFSPVVSPDGSRVWYTWQDPMTLDDLSGVLPQGRVIELDTGIDREAAFDVIDPYGYAVVPMAISPDGAWFLSSLSDADNWRGYYTIVVPFGEGGAARVLGPMHEVADNAWNAPGQFSPDGHWILQTYTDARSSSSGTWLFDVATGEGEKVPWPAFGGMSWQRLAP